jgi:hypothetical protein
MKGCLKVAFFYDFLGFGRPGSLSLRFVLRTSRSGQLAVGLCRAALRSGHSWQAKKGLPTMASPFHPSRASARGGFYLKMWI